MLKTFGEVPNPSMTIGTFCATTMCGLTNCNNCMFDFGNSKEFDLWNNPRVVEGSTRLKIIQVCNDLKEMLLAKNKAYGDSATDPLRMFGKSTPLEGLCTRIDDKLNRIYKGSEYPGDDTVNDLIGYLVLYKIIKKQEGQE